MAGKYEKYERMTPKELTEAYSANEEKFAKTSRGYIEEFEKNLKEYKKVQTNPYEIGITNHLLSRIDIDKAFLSNEKTLSVAPDKTYGDNEMAAALEKAGVPAEKIQSFIDDYYYYINQQKAVKFYYQKKTKSDPGKHADVPDAPPSSQPLPDKTGADHDDPQKDEEKPKREPAGPDPDPHDYDVDENGNIQGIDIPDYNKIKPDDDKTVVAAKHRAQLKILFQVRNAGKGHDTYSKNRKKPITLDSNGNAKNKDIDQKKYPDNSSQSSVPRPKETSKLSVASAYANTYTTFSGEDMVVTVEVPVDEAKGVSITRIIGQFQTISYSVHNEKTPVRNIGNMNARTYVFGPRTIAGSIVLIVFNRHWMKEVMAEYNQKAGIYSNYLADELPPINITISASNEYGKAAKLSLYGVTFVNEGQVMSINDLYVENTYQFFAQDIDYLSPVWKSKSKQNDNKQFLSVKKLMTNEGNKAKIELAKAILTGKETETKPDRYSLQDSIQTDPPILSEYPDITEFFTNLDAWKKNNCDMWDELYETNKRTKKQYDDGKKIIKNKYQELYKAAQDQQRKGGAVLL